MSFTIHHGDCREVMATLDAEGVDAIVCDPPYFLGFMNKGWDKENPKALDCDGLPGSRGHGRRPGESSSIARQNSIASYNVHLQWAIEALRVAKPGGYLLAFGGTRTYHRLACAIEDAGWEIRDCVMWVYGSGFPKSHDVSKAIDKAGGAERERIGGPKSGGMKAVNCHNAIHGYRPNDYAENGNSLISCEPITDAARQWQGWGTALKPAWEPIIVARKPLVGTVAENVLTHGTGAINVDGCRVGAETTVTVRSGNSGAHGRFGKDDRVFSRENPPGRWPANLIHDGSEEVVGLFPDRDGAVSNGSKGTTGSNGIYNEGWGAVAQKPGRADSGSAARFFYCAKASKADRDEGCEAFPEKENASGNYGTKAANLTRKDGGENVVLPRRNNHPTVKPTDLMRYLCRLVTPPGGIVLDPFTGSGSTGKAAILEGFRFIGIEREAEYVEIAKARITAAAKSVPPLLRKLK
jgi:DNA modification methylase